MGGSKGFYLPREVHPCDHCDTLGRVINAIGSEYNTQYRNGRLHLTPGLSYAHSIARDELARHQRTRNHAVKYPPARSRGEARQQGRPGY